MIRRIAGFTALAISATAPGLLPATPASAHAGVCAGSGPGNLSSGLYYLAPIGSGPKTVGFDFVFASAICQHGVTTNTMVARGTLTGNCDKADGTGSIAGHSFSLTSAGSVFVLTGGVVGVINAVPDAAAGQSCLKPGPGASRFLVTGEVNLI